MSNILKNNKKKKYLEVSMKGEIIVPKEKQKENTKFRSATEMETPLEMLSKEFPNVDVSLIDDMLDDNLRNIHNTREQLSIMYPCKQNENHNFTIQSTEISPDKNEKLTEQDIIDNINLQFSEEEDTPNDDRKSIYLKNKGIYLQMLTNEDYGKSILEENNFEFFISLLKDCFPNKSREEITKIICDYDFDIESALEYYLEQEKEDDTNNLQIDINSLSEYESDNDLLKIIKESNIQKEIYKEIKAQNLKQKLKEYTYSVERFPHLNQENIKINNHKIINDDINEEADILEKDLDKIKNKKIKDDLTKLFKKFPFEDEKSIRLLYYQFMDINKCSSYLIKHGAKEKKIGSLSTLFNSKNSFKNESSFYNNNKNDNYFDNNSDIYANNDIISIINSNKEKNQNQDKGNAPHNNDFVLVNSKKNNKNKKNEDKDISIQSINERRKNIIKLIQNAWRSGNKHTAKSLLTKAKIEKQEIINIMTKKLTNIEYNEFDSLNKFNEIDLHGLTLEESKMFISKKIGKILTSLKSGKINSKYIILDIITGKGKHSKNGSILYPGVLSWLNECYSMLKFKGDISKGIIKVLCKIQN